MHLNSSGQERLDRVIKFYLCFFANICRISVDFTLEGVVQCRFWVRIELARTDHYDRVATLFAHQIVEKLAENSGRTTSAKKPELPCRALTNPDVCFRFPGPAWIWLAV